MNAVEAVAEVVGMGDGQCLQVLQGRKADVEYLRWYCSACKGMFASACALSLLNVGWNLHVFRTRFCNWRQHT